MLKTRADRHDTSLQEKTCVTTSNSDTGPVPYSEDYASRETDVAVLRSVTAEAGPDLRETLINKN